MRECRRAHPHHAAARSAAPRNGHSPIISVDDHLIEPRHLFEGRMPAAARRPGAARGRGRRRQRALGVRRRHLPAGRAQRGRRPAEGRVDDGAGPLRRDAARLLGRRQRALADMDLDGVLRVAVLPVAHRRLRGHGLRADARTPSSASRACGRGTTGCTRSGPAPHPTRHPASSSPWLLDPGGRGRRGPRATPRAASKRSSASPRTRSTSGCPSLHTDHWDPFLRACEETRTVVCLHNGRRAAGPRPARRARRSSSTRRCSP